MSYVAKASKENTEENANSTSVVAVSSSNVAAIVVSSIAAAVAIFTLIIVIIVLLKQRPWLSSLRVSSLLMLEGLPLVEVSNMNGHRAPRLQRKVRVEYIDETTWPPASSSLLSAASATTSNRPNCDIKPTSLRMNCLPVDIVSAALSKAIVVLCLDDSTSGAYRSLCSVCRGWWKLVIGSRPARCQLYRLVRILTSRRRLSSILMKNDIAVWRMRSSSHQGFDRLTSTELQTILGKSLVTLCRVLLAQTLTAELTTITTLCSVSSVWWQNIGERETVKRLITSTTERICSPYRRHPQHIANAVTSRPVVAVAYIDDKLFVVSAASNRIRVVDCSDDHYSALRPIDVNHAKNLTDIVAWETNKRRLYVADVDCVWQLKQKGDVARWVPGRQLLSKDRLEPRSVAVVSSTLLLVATADFRFRFYGRDGRLVKTLVLDGVFDPGHVVVRPRDNRIVTCLRADVARSNGNHDNGTAWHVFRNKFSASFDDTGRGFYSDRNGVFLLSPCFQIVRLLFVATDSDAIEPKRVCFVQQIGRLFVCDRTARKLKVYNVCR